MSTWSLRFQSRIGFLSIDLQYSEILIYVYNLSVQNFLLPMAHAFIFWLFFFLLRLTPCIIDEVFWIYFQYTVTILHTSDFSSSFRSMKNSLIWNNISSFDEKRVLFIMQIWRNGHPLLCINIIHFHMIYLSLWIWVISFLMNLVLEPCWSRIRGLTKEK